MARIVTINSLEDIDARVKELGVNIIVTVIAEKDNIDIHPREARFHLPHTASGGERLAGFPALHTITILSRNVHDTVKDANTGNEFTSNNILVRLVVKDGADILRSFGDVYGNYFLLNDFAKSELNNIIPAFVIGKLVMWRCPEIMFSDGMEPNNAGVAFSKDRSMTFNLKKPLKEKEKEEIIVKKDELFEETSALSRKTCKGE